MWCQVYNANAAWVSLPTYLSYLIAHHCTPADILRHALQGVAGTMVELRVLKAAQPNAKDTTVVMVQRGSTQVPSLASKYSEFGFLSSVQ